MLSWLWQHASNSEKRMLIFFQFHWGHLPWDIFIAQLFFSSPVLEETALKVLPGETMKQSGSQQCLAVLGESERDPHMSYLFSSSLQLFWGPCSAPTYFWSFLQPVMPFQLHLAGVYSSIKPNLDGTSSRKPSLLLLMLNLLFPSTVALIILNNERLTGQLPHWLSTFSELFLMDGLVSYSLERP